MSDQDQEMDNQHYRLFAYQPSLLLEIFFAVAFFCTMMLHTVQMIQSRSWFFLPFVLGGYFECIGFVARALLINLTYSWQLGLHITETLLLLLAPTLFAGSIYMTLTRIIRLTNGQKHSVLPVKWLTKIFVAGDLISFCLQAAGGGLDAGAKTAEEEERGRRLIITGLIVQLVTFCLFIIHATIFYIRMKRAPTISSETLNTTWKRHLILLVGSSVLILIRSSFRLAEYVIGSHGPLMKKEIFTILLDSVLMFLCMLLFNLFHPSQALNESSDYPSEIPILETGEKGLHSSRSSLDRNV